MVGKKHTWKAFRGSPFQAQVLENKGEIIKNKEELAPPKGLLINDAETEKVCESSKKKRKTVNEVHQEIKELVEQEKFQEAESVLAKALQSGLKGKRLDRWMDYFMKDTEWKDAVVLVDPNLGKMSEGVKKALRELIDTSERKKFTDKDEEEYNHKPKRKQAKKKSNKNKTLRSKKNGKPRQNKRKTGRNQKPKLEE